MTAHGPMNKKFQDFLWLSAMFLWLRTNCLNSEAYMTAHGPMNLHDEPIKL
uniref:Uncharacterized protein n=1 Tax=Setaria viridis TaxID=4556 RepID=A0A4U6TXW6_SETVI|nr:hypothetical protein SEVIR_7G250650v2 [Setaria viridis]